MIINLTPKNIFQIANPDFLQYAQIYTRINENFEEQIRSTGMEFDENLDHETYPLLARLHKKGAAFRNSGKSISTHWLSSACNVCQKGVGTVTSFVSLKCHRNCFFCFNPNQENYSHFTLHKRECLQELKQMFRQGQKITHLALTGGEPLLHPKEMLDFFEYAKMKSPATHTRLYTSGDFLEREILQELKNAGLKEIRFSIKMDDPDALRKTVYDRIALAKEYIADVMVEMPVIPGSLPEMKNLLIELNQLKIPGINLLEFCFPFHNAKEFIKRGYLIKNPPFQVLYDYWYAGGLPISRSELECLYLMEFALDEQLKLGVHYCSLENKQTGQIYQQNYGQKVSDLMFFSSKSYFFKSAKVFGKDIDQVKNVFKQRNITQFQLNRDYKFLEFHVNQIQFLKDLNLEVGISSNIMETREDGQYLRELKIDLVYPEDFDLENDI